MSTAEQIQYEQMLVSVDAHITEHLSEYMMDIHYQVLDIYDPANILKVTQTLLERLEFELNYYTQELENDLWDSTLQSVKNYLIEHPADIRK